MTKKAIIILLLVIVCILIAVAWCCYPKLINKNNDVIAEKIPAKEVKIGVIADYFLESSIHYYDEMNEVLLTEKGKNVAIKEILMPKGSTVFQEGSGREKAMQDLINRGANIIVTMSYTFANPIKKIAHLYPDVEFVLTDGFLPGQYPTNVTSYQMPFAEMGFLAGAVAGLRSEREKTAIVLDVHSAETDELFAGFVQGVRYAAPHCKVEKIVLHRLNETITLEKDEGLLTQKLREIYNMGVDVVFSQVDLMNAVIAKNASTHANLEFIALDKVIPSELETYKSKSCLASILIDYRDVLSKICNDFLAGKLQHKNVELPIRDIKLLYIEPSKDINLSALPVEEQEKIRILRQLWEKVSVVENELLNGKIDVQPYLTEGSVTH